MIRACLGKGSDMAAAVNMAAADIVDAQFVLFFSRVGSLKDAASAVAALFPDIPTMGLCSPHILHNGELIEQDIMLIAFEREQDFAITSGVIRDVVECPVQHIFQFEQSVDAVNPGENNTFCLEYCTGGEEQLVSTLNAVLDKYHIPLMGTTVFEGFETYGVALRVAYNGKLYKDACIYAVIKCLRGTARIYYENIFQRMGGRVWQVTKADPATSVLMELNGRPAADVYCEVMHISSYDEIPNMTIRYPLGRIIGDRYYVMSVGKVFPDGSMYCNKRINPNDALCFLNFRAFRDIARETVALVKKENPHIDFLLTGDCCHRYLLYNQENFLDTHVKNLHSLGSHVGNICGGEQYHHQHINQSLVLAVFSSKG